MMDKEDMKSLLLGISGVAIALLFAWWATGHWSLEFSSALLRSSFVVIGLCIVRLMFFHPDPSAGAALPMLVMYIYLPMVVLAMLITFVCSLFIGFGWPVYAAVLSVINLWLILGLASS